MERLTELIDELEFGFGWVSPQRPKLRIASHALAAEGRVWLFDPAPGAVEERIRGLGEPEGVVQLLDRHERACADWARRLSVPHHVVPFGRVGPFEAVPVVRRAFWRESALWWPEGRVLLCADALGTIPHYFTLGGERLGVHPLLRLTPPQQLARYDPEHVLCGHGDGVHEGAAEAVRDALVNARGRALRLPLELVQAARR